ncbi:RNA polymerase sigma-70 factor [Fodinibius sp. Rm-B-1B1-1]|uniref:RNA polymerase sigma-70 factor n=1 Tax=Fodinibius alkaliphilus TaxID=3140241 RepID=UPI00315A5247
MDKQLRRIRNGDEKAFEKLFSQYYPQLCAFAVNILDSRELAKDCVQEVFLKIWRNRENWQINYSVSVYLYQAVRNQALNRIEKRNTSRDYTQKYYEQGFHEREEEEVSPEKAKLVAKVWEVAETMPRRRRMVFELHRKHGLSYKEIAYVMDITRKTVENHMGQALQDIREKLDA